MLAFSVLGGAAIALRKKPDASKRLIILATIFIADAGFARWWGGGLEKLLGDGYWANWAQLFIRDFLFAALLGAYDLISRRKLYPAYMLGAAWGLGLEFLAVWLYIEPVVEARGHDTHRSLRLAGAHLKRRPADSRPRARPSIPPSRAIAR